MIKKNIPTIKRKSHVFENDPLHTTFQLLPIYGVFIPTKGDKMMFQIFIGDKPEIDENGVWQPGKKCLFTFKTASYQDCQKALDNPTEIRQLDIMDWKEYQFGMDALVLEHNKKLTKLNKTIKNLKLENEKLKNKTIIKFIREYAQNAFDRFIEKTAIH